MSLSIQKSAANCAAADSEISNKTASLSIQKSTMKNCVAIDLEIDNNGGVIFGFTLFCVFTGLLKCIYSCLEYYNVLVYVWNAKL
jgi:hypothetical protein